MSNQSCFALGCLLGGLFVYVFSAMGWKDVAEEWERAHDLSRETSDMWRALAESHRPADEFVIGTEIAPASETRTITLDEFMEHLRLKPCELVDGPAEIQYCYGPGSDFVGPPLPFELLPETEMWYWDATDRRVRPASEAWMPGVVGRAYPHDADIVPADYLLWSDGQSAAWWVPNWPRPFQRVGGFDGEK